MVTITKCSNEAEMDGVSAALRPAGIEHIVRRATAGAPGWEVAVQDADSERADEIVNEIYGIDTREAVEPPVAPAAVVQACDACGSIDIGRVPKLQIFLLGVVMSIGFAFVSDQRMERLSFLIIVAVAIAVLILDRWRCRDCGHTWK
jgi:hypothetical protein